MAPRSAQRQPARQDTSADDESLLVAAMANTESEIFAEAMGDEELELDGDTSLEEMDDPAGEEEDAEDGDAGDEPGDDERDGPLRARGDDQDPNAEDDQDDDQSGDGRRPEARQEPRRFTLPPVDPSAARIAELEARLARVEAPSKIDVKPVTAADLPDPVLDPAGFRAGIAAEIRAENQQATRTAILENNFRATEAAYTREDRRDEFELAASQLNELSLRARTDPSAAAAVRSIVNAPDPGYALMQWAEDNLDLENFREEARTNKAQQAARLLEELGYDPSTIEGLQPARQAQRQERRQEGRQENRARGEQRQQPAQRGGKRLPSLNSAGGVGREGGNSRNLDPRGFDGSEEGIFNSAFTN